MQTKPTVVNCLKEQCSHYCGRPSSFTRARGNPVNLSILGNPYPMGDESERKAVIDQYRVWLWSRVKCGGEELVAIESIPEGAVLGCFCAPKACHCDVIADAWAWLKSAK